MHRLFARIALAAYAGDSVPGASFVNARKFRWWAGTTSGFYYDIRWFKVTYAYYVLV